MKETATVCTGCERLRDAILDIDAHATPLGEDDDGFVTGGYLISVGSLHRALGLVGHTAPKCRLCDAGQHACGTDIARIISAVVRWASASGLLDKARADEHLRDVARRFLGPEMQRAGGEGGRG